MLQRLLPDSTRTYATVGLAAMLGHYYETCGPARHFRGESLAVGWRRESPAHVIGLEGQYTAGWDRLRDPAAPARQMYSDNLRISAASLRVTIDGPIAGVELGGATGTLVHDGAGKVRAEPILGFRFGPPDVAWTTLSYGCMPTGCHPKGLVRLGVGFAIDSGRSNVQVGLSELGALATARIALPHGTELVPVVMRASSAEYELAIRVDHAFRLRR